MNNDPKEFLYSLVLTTIINEKTEEEDIIDTYIEQYSIMPMLMGKVTEEDKKYVKNRITAERSIKLSKGYVLEGEERHQKWFLSKKAELSMAYWDRYSKYLLEEKHFAHNVVNTMDEMLDNLTDLLGNPDIEGQFQRRGLIIGDVQSGKTSNYTGLICKAADSGYKVIVLLTGVIEKLRKQTQSRIDEGFVGMDSQALMKGKNDNIIGVGNYNPSVYPVVFTTTEFDFKTNLANTVGIKIGQVNQPMIFVIKKNVSTLRNLNKWLKMFNANGEDKIDSSILVVDDESDNASVNTNNEDQNPTTINGKIRELLAMFTRASYVGFTATPFANIFIDPETNDSMQNEDLFPKDYIYCLNAPSNYIGARDIFGEDGEHKGMLRKINKEVIELYIPYKHKNWHILDAMPSDMIEAIETFLLANVIRDLRGDIKNHRSMLINVSRFTNIQNSLAVLVNNYLKEIQASARIFSQLSASEALNNSVYFRSLYKTFERQYSHLEFTWKEISKQLYKSIAPIITTTVNKDNSNGLNYEEYEEVGLRAIAIGGLSLSRGLTLEGLIVSYFYRNSKMYDTLMQMGRWFGYRGGYDDLCRIWMEEDGIEWYKQINRATEELRNDLKKYDKSGRTPKEFGIRVRSDVNTLLVTARNKMRTASNMEVCISLSGEVIETPCIYNDIAMNELNKEAVNSLKENLLKNYKVKTLGKTVGFGDVDKSYITEFLRNFNVSVLNNCFDCDSIKEFIEGYVGDELERWDIAFASGSAKKTFFIDTFEAKKVERKYLLDNDNKIIKLSGNKKRLGSPSDGMYFLNESQIKEIRREYEKDNEKKVDTLSQKAYFRYGKRNPLLVIYYIDLRTDRESEDFRNTNVLEDIVGLSIGIPNLSGSNSHYARYKINKIQRELLQFGDLNDYGDDE
ncbi:MAG: Z1 domain-containing protein [Clostridium sp.]|uniref:Z1 domain-containing protein n=1 Tax=Clostridium sp. TaxID=1506 RepID=UPI002909EB29|nr:Z1 domain-containing protein [Clostridium sp.]MDU5110579.1 Z1 domain-containing protein [Clostridium sp.]